MARILGYIATSLDGFIATPDDSLDWLFAYGDLDLGEHDYRQFIKRIRTVVMGRGTYDFLARDGTPWAYRDQRVLVVTSRPIPSPKGPLEVRDSVDDLVLESVVAADDRVLPGDQRTEVQANGVFPCPANGRRVADANLKRIGACGLNCQFGSHSGSLTAFDRLQIAQSVRKLQISATP